MGKGFAHEANIEFESEIEALDQSIALVQQLDAARYQQGRAAHRARAGRREIIHTDKIIL